MLFFCIDMIEVTMHSEKETLQMKRYCEICSYKHTIFKIILQLFNK
jgi:hypothetical protein